MDVVAELIMEYLRVHSYVNTLHTFQDEIHLMLSPSGTRLHENQETSRLETLVDGFFVDDEGDDAEDEPVPGRAAAPAAGLAGRRGSGPAAGAVAAVGASVAPVQAVKQKVFRLLATPPTTPEPERRQRQRLLATIKSPPMPDQKPVIRSRIPVKELEEDEWEDDYDEGVYRREAGWSINMIPTPPPSARKKKNPSSKPGSDTGDVLNIDSNQTSNSEEEFDPSTLYFPPVEKRIELVEKLAESMKKQFLAKLKDGTAVRKAEPASSASAPRAAATRDAPVIVSAGGASPATTKSTDLKRSPSSRAALQSGFKKFASYNLKVVYERGKSGFGTTRDFKIRKGQLIAGRYRFLSYLGAATFSTAIRCRDIVLDRDVCMKVIKNRKSYFDQALDEVKVLHLINKAGDADQVNVVTLLDFFYFQEHLFIVTELLKDNLYELYQYHLDYDEKPYFTVDRLQVVAQQLFSALHHLHSQGIIHADLKPENVMSRSYLKTSIKVIDFGNALFKGDEQTFYVQSRSYRCPEVLLGIPYDEKIDMWSAGCLLFELATGRLMFECHTVLTLIAKIIGMIGPIPQWMISKGCQSRDYFTREGKLYEWNDDRGVYEFITPKQTSLSHRLGDMQDPDFLDFMTGLMTVDPKLRLSAEEALAHPWLQKDY